MSEWQPIETAPKDGTSIDVWVVNQFVRQSERNREWRIPDVHWGTPSQGNAREVKPDGWVRYDCPYWTAIEMPLSGGEQFITHWMPLPASPLVTSKEHS